MDITDVGLGFLIGAAVGPAAGLYVGIVTGLVIVRHMLKTMRGDDKDE